MEVIRKKIQRLLWLTRFLIRTFLRRPHNGYSPVVALSEIPVYFINLATRPDRLRETLDEFRRIGISDAVRFEAVTDVVGARGCALSHEKLITQISGKHDFAMICEDDVEFILAVDEIKSLVNDFLQNPTMDVLCLAYNLRSPRFRLRGRLAIASDIFSTSCYIVKRSAFDALAKVCGESASRLGKGESGETAALDVLWTRLQKGRLIFAVPRKRAARQRASFSDIEGRDVFYGV